MRLPFVVATLFGLWLAVAAGELSLRGSRSPDDPALEQTLGESVTLKEEQRHRHLLDCKGKDKNKPVCKDKKKDEDDKGDSGDKDSESGDSESESLDSSSWSSDSREEATDAQLDALKKQLDDEHKKQMDSLDEFIYNDAYSVLNEKQKKKLLKKYNSKNFDNFIFDDNDSVLKRDELDSGPELKRKRKPKDETPEQKKKRKNQELDDLLGTIGKMVFRDQDGNVLDITNKEDKKLLKQKMDQRAKKILARKWADQMRFKDEDGNLLTDPLLINAVRDFQIKEFMKASGDLGVDELTKRLKKDQGHVIPMTLKRDALDSLERQVQVDHWDMMDTQEDALDRAKKEKRKDKLRDQILRLDNDKVIKDKEGKIVTDPKEQKRIKKLRTRAVIMREVIPKDIQFTDREGNVREMDESDRKLMRYYEARSLKKKIDRMLNDGRSIEDILEATVPADPSKSYTRQDKFGLAMKGRYRSSSVYGDALQRIRAKEKREQRNRGYSQARPTPPALSRAQSVKHARQKNKHKRGNSVTNVLRRISRSFRSGSKKNKQKKRTGTGDMAGLYNPLTGKEWEKSWKKKNKDEKIETVVNWAERADNTKDIVSSGLDGTWSEMFDSAESGVSLVLELLASLG